MEKEYKTTDAQRKAIREYEKKNDRINVIFPAGTRDRIEKLNLKISTSEFIKTAVEEKLQNLEKLF